MKITPEETILETLFAGIDTSYTVPKYQRSYSWKEDEVDNLWNDIVTSFNNKSEYFMGPIVLNSEGHDEGHYDVVDGQQRLATFTILFSVMRSIAKNFHSNNNILPQVERSEANLKIARKLEDISNDRILYRSEPDNYFLKLINKDFQTFKEEVQDNLSPLLSDAELRIVSNESRVKKTKKIFFRKIVKSDNVWRSPNGLQVLYDYLIHVIKKMKFISIKVESDYDAYLLFESLNSKGLPLSVIDLLKNKFLMVCKDNETNQEEVLMNWDQMIQNLATSKYNPVDFTRFYWLAFHGDVTKKELYKEIKRYVEIPDANIVSFSKELKDKAEKFTVLTNTEIPYPSTSYSADSLEQHLAEINTLNYSICLPAFIYARYYRMDILPELAKRSLNFLFRLITIGDYSVGTAKSTFDNVLQSLKDGKDESEIFATFEREKEKIADEHFKSAFKFLSTNNNNFAKYVLTKIEAHLQGPEKITNSKEVHLEHILPQTPTKWIEAGFDVDNRNIDDLIYSIGNMTLLNSSLNQSIKNDVFANKVGKYMKKENAEMEGSIFKITYTVHQEYQDEGRDWTVESIISRANYFAELATEIWKI